MENDERKTLNEWYAFNKNVLSSKARLYIEIQSKNNSVLCNLEGDIDYIIKLVGNLKIIRFRPACSMNDNSFFITLSED